MNIFTFLINLTVFIDRFIVPFIFAIAFLVFIWGVAQYFILNGGNSEKREEGKSFIMYGIGGFVIMIAIWGIVNLILNTLGFQNNYRPALPTFGSPNSSQSGDFFNGAQNVPTTGTVPVGGACTGPAQCASPGICVINGNTGEGTCKAN